MESCINHIIEINEKQSYTNKVEILIHELLNEFDILVRRSDTDSLKEIYNYVIDNSPIKTVDKTYNNNHNEKLSRDILKKLVMLDDLSLLENQLIKHMQEGSEKDVLSFIKSWESFTFVYYHLQDFYNYQLELVERGEFGTSNTSSDDYLDDYFDEDIVADEVEEESNFDEVDEDKPIIYEIK